MKCLLFLIILGSGIISYALDAERILQDALIKSASADFAAEIINPFTEESIQIIILPRTEKWKFYRQTTPDGVNLRLDMYDDSNSIQVSYIQNNSGTYGTDNDAWNAKVLNVPYLWFPELTHAAIMPEEWRQCKFEVNEAEFNGRKCYEVTAKYQYDEASVAQSDPLFSYYKNEYLKKRTFIKRFMIDKETELILSRRHYNKDGEQIFICEFANVDFETKLSDSLFKTPDDIKYTFWDWKGFASKKLETMWLYPDTPKYNFSRIYKVIGGVIAGFAAVLGIIIFAKWRKKQN